MRRHAETVSRNFYGVTGSALGTWEALALIGTVPKVTTLVRRRKLFRVLMVFWSIGLAHHFWEKEREQ